MNAPFTDHAELKKAIVEHIERAGPHCSLNHLDVSQIVNFSELFENSLFNGDISQWNVSKVASMKSMFLEALFNGDISDWNVANVTNMEAMFCSSKFNGDISRWNVSNVKSMFDMFKESSFNGDISQWNTQRVQAIQCIFFNTPFKGDISQWELSSLVTHENAFHQFHDSPLGYMGVLEGRYAVPNDFGCAARFNELRSLCDGLKMDALSAAQYIYQEVRQPAHFDDVDFNLGVYELLV